MSGYWLNLHDSVDPSWWRPLERLAAQLSHRVDLPPIDPDDYVYCARVRRENLPVLHVYRNVLSHRYLNVDEMGLTWRYVGGNSPYALCEVDDALARADLARAELLARRTRRGARRPLPSTPAPAPTDDAEDRDAEDRDAESDDGHGDVGDFGEGADLAAASDLGEGADLAGASEPVGV